MALPFLFFFLLHIFESLQIFTLCVQELDMIVEAYNDWGVHDDTIEKVSQQMRNGITA